MKIFRVHMTLSKLLRLLHGPQDDLLLPNTAYKPFILWDMTHTHQATDLLTFLLSSFPPFLPPKQDLC